MEKTKLKTYAKLGYSEIETAEIVNRLNHLLANYQIHYQKLRNFHWNIKGSNFFDLHERFEDHYKRAQKNIDEIAERIRTFGKVPLSNFSKYLEISEIEEASTDLTSIEMVREILNDYQILLSMMIETVESADNNGDVGTRDLVMSQIKKIEKSHWMFSAWLNYGQKEPESEATQN